MKFIVFYFLTVFPILGFACSCSTIENWGEHLEKYDHIFVGKLTQARLNENGDVESIFKIIEVLKGVPSELSFFTSPNGEGACGFQTVLGGEYLVIANNKGEFHLCNGSCFNNESLIFCIHLDNTLSGLSLPTRYDELFEDLKELKEFKENIKQQLIEDKD